MAYLQWLLGTMFVPSASEDCTGNWRFHWMEVVIQKALQWLPLAWPRAWTHQ
jgi:hypothetical protein